MARLSRTILLADLHLIRDTPDAVTHDLARLIEAHPGARIIIAGDLFDIAASLPRLPPTRAIAEALGAHPLVRTALARHLEHGGQLCLIGGNHDAALGSEGITDTLHHALGATAEARARLRISPWFIRDGGLHVEHGHVYDPDNAPAHPLVHGRPSLGVHFSQEFIATTGAHRYLQANDDTPLRLFLSSFTWYGPRAPYVIYRYFHTAISAILNSGPLYRARAEIDLGQARLEHFAEQIGIPRATIDELLTLGATPTLESLARTFTRLYFDRVLATIAMTSGLGMTLLGGRKKGITLLGLGALAMAGSWAKGHNRYRGTVSEQLQASAEHVAQKTGASLVVFGHTHREALTDTYANTGSFSFPRGAPGRPYLEIEGPVERPRAIRRYWPAPT